MALSTAEPTAPVCWSCVISENLAREYWSNPADALGNRITQSQENPWREIIGVVGNERQDGLYEPPAATVYWPLLIKDWWNQAIDVSRIMAFVVRSARVSSSGFLREVQQAVRSFNPRVTRSAPFGPRGSTGHHISRPDAAGAIKRTAVIGRGQCALAPGECESSSEGGQRR